MVCDYNRWIGVFVWHLEEQEKMKKWCTLIRAICPITKELTTFAGPVIEAPSPKLAHEYCQSNGLGYCRVTGDEFIASVSCGQNESEPSAAAWNIARDTHALQYN